MKVLWLTNIALPEANVLMNEKVSPFGGWLVNSSGDLANNIQGDLAISFPSTKANQYSYLKGEKICYFPFEPISDKPKYEEYKKLENILIQYNPDIVHIFGTEFSHSLVMISLCNKHNIKSVVSIQGLISYCANYYMADLPNNIQKRFTFRDFIKMDNLNIQRRKFRLRGKSEVKALRACNYVIGRTTWDRACAMLINPDLEYHCCNESLRESFYKNKWTIEKCEKHSIFISQASYPLKGAHYMLEAMESIVNKFPDAKLYIAGYNITKRDTLLDKIKIGSYGKYLVELIDKYNIKNNVVFTGIINEEEMCKRYLKSNVFVCPSSIENSPNSLGEAMLLGVPCVAAGVGGVTDMIKMGEEGFVYQGNSPEMLSYYVCKIFEDQALAKEFSIRSREHAKITHSRDENTRSLMQIYNNIVFGK